MHFCVAMTTATAQPCLSHTPPSSSSSSLHHCTGSDHSISISGTIKQGYCSESDGKIRQYSFRRQDIGEIKTCNMTQTFIVRFPLILNTLHQKRKLCQTWKHLKIYVSAWYHSSRLQTCRRQGWGHLPLSDNSTCLWAIRFPITTVTSPNHLRHQHLRFLHMCAHE